MAWAQPTRGQDLFWRSHHPEQSNNRAERTFGGHLVHLPAHSRVTSHILFKNPSPSCNWVPELPLALELNESYGKEKEMLLQRFMSVVDSS